MFRAGLIGAVAGFIYVMSLTLLSPFCTLCFTPLLGIGVGYLAGWIDTPPASDVSMWRGGLAGLLAGFGVVVGQMLASVVNAILITNWKMLPRVLQEFGLSELTIRMITDSNQYWLTTLIENSLCSIFNLFIIAFLGAIGGLIWFQRRHRALISTAAA